MSLERFRAHKSNPDYTYMTLGLILILFGLVMISSSSVVLSSEIYNQSYGFVIRQSISLLIGLVAFFIASRIEFQTWKKPAPIFLLLSICLLAIVFIPGVGKTTKGAARWIDLGIFQLQPSEIVKLSLILYLSLWFEKKGKLIKSFSQGLIPFIILLVPAVFFLMLQRDLGTLLVILFTSAAMFVVAGSTLSQIGVGMGVGFSTLAMLIAIAPYRMQRLATFFNPEESDKLGAGYHVNQLNIAIGSGGLWGRGFGQSLQKYLYLPEPQTDSIFAIIVEELGFFRTFLVLTVIGLFTFKGYDIARRCTDPFGRMVAFGITTSLFVQAAINIAAALGLVPLTGVPLPFISYGGTSLIISLVGVGIVVNISKYAYKNNS